VIDPRVYAVNPRVI